METKIYVTNLAKYNEGKLVGQWVDLPQPEGDLETIVKDVLGTDEEYFCSDYEADFKIEEYENVYELNNFVERLDELDEYDRERTFYLMDMIGYSRNEALEHYEEVVYYRGMTLEDVAYELVEEGVFGELSDNIKGYIDFEKLARDLGIDGYYEADSGTFWYQ